MSKEKLATVFSKEFLAFRLPAQIADLNNIYGEKSVLKVIDWNQKLNARKDIDAWKNKHYSDTLKENVQILDDYLTLCEKNNVRPIMFLPTMTQARIKYSNKKAMDEFYYLVNQAQRKHPAAVFFDGWKLNFPDTDFYDTAHLNLNGAAKFSTILNGVIEEIEEIERKS